MELGVGVGIFSLATTGAVLTLLAQLDEATSEHPKFELERDPIEVFATHELGTVKGQLVIDAHLCPMGMLMVTSSFEQMLPDLISMEIGLRVAFAEQSPLMGMMFGGDRSA